MLHGTFSAIWDSIWGRLDRTCRANSPGSFPLQGLKGRIEEGENAASSTQQHQNTLFFFFLSHVARLHFVSDKEINDVKDERSKYQFS